VLANNLVQLDHDHLIHPVASWSAHEQRGVTVLRSGDGCYVEDYNGNRLLDGFAGLWCVNVGYGQQSIVDAATAQMTALPYATGYFGFGSEPAIRLAARVAELTPGDLNHVYFTLGGSDAVDSAVKFIRYYWNVLGQPQRKHMIALQRGYHGSTSVGSGLTALPAFHANFNLPTPEQHHIPSPYPYRHRTGIDADVIADSVASLRAKVEELGAGNVAAFFCEPIQGSGGVIVPPKGWLKAMREACRDLDILFVADEVITGFGRTGPMFGCEAEGVVPDIMTVAKGLTAGYAPMGATILGEKIYRTIADNAPAKTPIGHGFTYSGHPVSAAVGLEVLRLYTEGGILANGQRSGAHLATRLAQLADHPLVGNVRSAGLLAGIELVADKSTKAKHAAELNIPDRLSELGYRNKLIFRSFGDNIVGLAPSLACTLDEVDLIVDRLTNTLDELLSTKEIRNATN
jgi:adenosylmethionine-8-amino-7-oxononanoate aminotransferase